MFKKLDGMLVRKKMITGYLIVIVLMVFSGILAIVGETILLRNLSNYSNKVQRADTAVQMCRLNVNMAARNIREMALNDDKSSYDTYKKNVDDALKNIDQELDVMKKTGVIEDKLYNQYVTQMNEWGTIGMDIIDEIEAGNQKDATEKILTKCAPALSEAVDTAKEIQKITDEQVDKLMFASKRDAVFNIIGIIIFNLIGIASAVVVGKRIIASILIPLAALEETTKELSQGNLHSTLDYQADDELGSLADSLRSSIATLSSYVDDIGASMQEFEKGNFVVNPSVEWKGDFKGILTSFKAFEHSMADMITNVQSVADQVTNGAEQVAAGSMDLAEGATEQAGVTEELTATIDEVSERVSGNAKNAKDISKEVESSEEAVMISNQKMQEMVEAMDEISNTSQEIGNIIAAINDIASQTNLLALNASIEAARAGEAGKGFAVVADQVSLLAAQSAEAAKESRDLIETSVSAVERGKVIADETAKQLEQVVESSKAATAEVYKIAVALEADAATMTQINQGVEQINSVVQTNSATSQQCAAASQEMSDQAGTLEQLIKSFKIRK